jgi:DNA ligase-3
MADNRFACDYAKRNTSSCKKCKKKLEKGELRLAKVVANFFHDGEGEMKQYHHPACLFETFVRARSTTKIIESPDDIEGFGDLEQPEKDLINQLIKGLFSSSLIPVFEIFLQPHGRDS